MSTEPISGGAFDPSVVVAAAGGPTPLEPGGPNAIAMSYGLLADEWALWILRQALRGATHYTDWVHAGPIPGSALTSRLSSLVDGELLEKIQYQDRPPRHEYRLTARGRQVWPILIAMWGWERLWVHDSGHELPQMRHTTCGSFADPLLTCATCGDEVVWNGVDGEVGPSGDWTRNVPQTSRRQRSRGDKRPDEVVTETMELIGNRWSMAIMGIAMLGVTRFSDFQRRLSASPTVIADRLRTFGELGVLTQVPAADRPDLMEYRLTPKGKAFLPVVLLMIEWGQLWFRAPDGPALLLTHRPCGTSLHTNLRLTCSSCGELLRGFAIETVQSGSAPSVEPLL